MVLLLPPAPAALVLLGRTFATLSFWSAAALLRIAVFGPPGGVGDEGRPVLCPAPMGELTGDEGRGEDCAFMSVNLRVHTKGGGSCWHTPFPQLL